MATSGSTNFSIDRNGIINAALRVVGALDPEAGSVSPTQITNAAEALNIIVKAWHADGMPLWAIRKSSFSLTSTTTYTATTLAISRPIRIIGAFIRDSTVVATPTDTPLNILTRDEYNALGSKQSTGTPNSIYYDPGLTDALSIVNVYPKPDTNAIAYKAIHIIHQRPFEDFDASTDTPDFPQEWYSPLKWQLAADIGFEYGLTERRLTLLSQKAKMEKEAILGMGTESGSLFLQPERR